MQLYINDEFFDQPSQDNAYLSVTAPKLDILFENEHILLLNKPEGQAVHPHDGAEYGRTLIDHIQAYLYAKGQWKPREEHSFTPALCNRIDRNTSGIVIAAKTAEALRIMNQKIKDRELQKRYLCIVHGIPSPPKGRLEGQLWKDAAKNRVYISDRPQPGSKTAITDYEVLQSKNGLSLVQIDLITGRTHQIRAQMAHAGHPLLGDGKLRQARPPLGPQPPGPLRLEADLPLHHRCRLPGGSERTRVHPCRRSPSWRSSSVP